MRKTDVSSIFVINAGNEEPSILILSISFVTDNAGRTLNNFVFVGTKTSVSSNSSSCPSSPPCVLSGVEFKSWSIEFVISSWFLYIYTTSNLLLCS